MGLLESLKAKMGASAGRPLEGYPAYRAPHRGPAARLSVEEANANLQYLLAHKQERLDVLTAHLGTFGIDLKAGAAASDVQPLLERMHQWAVQEWPPLYDKRTSTTARWLASTREGEEIVYSLLMDLAILFGEMVIARRPRFAWALDLDPENTEMLSYKRPVAQIAKGEPFPAPVILDFEHIVVGNFFQCQTRVFAKTRPLTRAVTQAVNGEHEQYWAQEMPPAGSTS